MKKIAAIILTLALLFALVSCGAKTAETESTSAQAPETTEAVSETETETASGAESETESETAAESTTKAEETGKKEEETSAEESTTEKAKVPSTTAEILAAYTEVMNQAKKDAPGFTKVEYQELPSDSNSRVVSKGGAVVNAALGVAGNFMTSEEDARKDPEIKEKGNNMRSWPVCKSPKGCMLTDTGALKSAKCEVLPDGNYKITLVLRDEANPEPAADGGTTAPSKHGAVFSPMSKAEIDETLKGGIVSAVAKEITYNLVYHDCVSTVVYNPENNHVVSMDQTTHVTISGQGKVVGIQMIVDKQELIDYMHISNIKY